MSQSIILALFLANIFTSGAEKLQLYDKLQVSILYYLSAASLAAIIFLLTYFVKNIPFLNYIIFNLLCISGYFIFLDIGVEALKPFILGTQDSLASDVYIVEAGHPESNIIYKVGLLNFSDFIAWNMIKIYLLASLLIGNISILLDRRK